MKVGEVREVGHGTTDLHYVETGMFDIEGYSSVYLLDAEEPAVIETGIGTEWEAIVGAMETVGIAPEELAYVAPTHVHLDHAGGAGYLAEACPNAEVVIHEIGAPHLVDPGRLWEGTKRAVGDQIRHYAEPKPVPEERIREVTDGDLIDLGDHELAVHHVPGHAPHQVVHYDPANDAVFTADAAGIYVPDMDAVKPTTPPPNFDVPQAVDDTRTIADLGPSVLCYSHFGPLPAEDRLDEHERALTEFVELVEERRELLGDDEAVVQQFVEGTDLADAWSPDRARAVAEMDVRGILRYLDTREE
ncbi:MBL fold metallo-hydrolase [Salinirubellus sp. GCM10025818]|uniref:MBL fold metallo-hydrolase n=1 Tax=Salinirubellus TaxID=2162630 RepID=UPI0030D52D0E